MIKVNNKTDFQITSNVSSTSFGVHDIDARILEYILNQREQRLKRHRKPVECENQSEIDHAYKELIKSIKEDVSSQNSVKKNKHFLRI